MKFHLPNFLIVFVVATLFASCSNHKQDVKPVSLQGKAQGTYYTIIYYDSLNRNFQPQIDSLLDAFDKSVSLWVQNSIISRVNRNDTTVKLDSNFIGNFKYSQQVSKETKGAFDITVGPLVEVWGFGFENRENVTPEIVDSLLKIVGYKKIKIINGNVIKADPRMQIDFNAIAQGYSDDVVGKFLQSKGILNYLVDIGGEVKAKGQKTNGPWRVGIEKPSVDKNSQREVEIAVALKNKSLATSGNYRKYYIKNGKRYAHTINPHTGYPVQHSLLSASVLADNTALADAYATAFMVMGFQKSKEFVLNHPGLEAYFIYSGKNGKFKTYATPGFKKIILKRVD